MAKSTVCLAMICKNEAHILRRCLDSALPFVEAVCIIDTGSTDRTFKLACGLLENFDGEVDVLERPWVDFGHNRTELLAEARKLGTDYILALDADHVLEAPDDAFDDLTADSYLIELPDASMSYWIPYLTKASKPWKYVGRTHEYLSCDEPFLQEKHPTISLQHWGDGGTRPEKIDRDRSLLERAYEEDPDNERTVFYLAQTYKDSGDLDGARAMYAKRAAMGGWDEEVYWSLYQVAEIERTADAYLAALHARPGRPEAIHGFLQLCNQRGWQSTGYSVGREWEYTTQDDVLFLEKWKAEYGIEFEHSIAAWWSGHKTEAEEGFEMVLEHDNLPKSYRDACKRNLAFCE